MTPGTAANPEAVKLNGYPLFDWLRLALASIVVLDHAGLALPHPVDGRLAVEVFFALSGWLIGGILLRTDRAELPRFFFNRSTRIWIPYALAIVLLYGVALAKEGPDIFWLKYLVMDLTFTHQIFTVFPAALTEMPLDGSGNQFWSISVEEQFYLLAPLLILFVRGGRSIALWFAIAVAMMGVGWHFAAIALGVCAAIMEAKTSFSGNPITRWTALAIAILCAVAMAALSIDRIAPIFAVALVVAMAKPGRRRPMAEIAGGLSYPLYLNHWIGVFVVNFLSKRYFPISHTAFVWAEYVLNLLIALALYLLVDRQIQLRRNNWYSDAIGRWLAITAYVLVSIGIGAGVAFQQLVG
ncbi:MAG: acyltransferase [Sphingomonadales bacterium]|nr:acyltransferase [Sphingomonadales bacterium]